MKRHPDPESFLKDVSKHGMEVMLNSGGYRHLHFSNHGSFNMYFDLVTWPGNLAIRGDMGTWVFSRTPDMFNFFRNKELRINPHYWSEKIQNGVNGGRDSAKEFDCELWGDKLREIIDQSGLEGDALKDLREAFEDDVASRDSQHEMMSAVQDFKHGDFSFELCDIPDGTDYHYHFIWCLYAIVWGIQQYDSLAEREEPKP